MKKLNIKNIYEWPIITRGLIIGIICAIVFYFAYSWDISGLNEELATSKAKEDDLKQQLAVTINKQISLANDISQFNRLKQMLSEWQNKLVSSADVPELMNYILKMGAQNQIYFALFDPGDEVRQDDDYLKLPIKVIAVGSYHHIADFVSQIANMNWIVVVDQFAINREIRNDRIGAKLAQLALSQNLLTADLTLEIFRYAPLPPPSDGDKAKKAGGTPTSQVTSQPADSSGGANAH